MVAQTKIQEETESDVDDLAMKNKTNGLDLKNNIILK